MENPPVQPHMARAATFGLAASVPIALGYGVLSDPFGLSWGLIVVGVAAGWLIGLAVTQGAYSGRFHLRVPRLQWLAGALAVIAWVAAVLVGYVASQFFYQAATTPLVDRLSIAGWLEYLNNTIFSPSIFGLVAMAFFGWRGAR